MSSPGATVHCEMEFERVRDILAYRFPFLMIDRVLHVERGRRITAIKNVTGNEIHFLGHFPHLAVMPGVLIVEAVAQALTILYLLGNDIHAEPDSAAHRYMSNVSMTFKSPVVPGDCLRIEGEITKWVSRGLAGKAKVYVEDREVGFGNMILGLKADGSHPL